MLKLIYLIIAFLTSLTTPTEEPAAEEPTEFISEDGTDIDMSLADLPEEFISEDGTDIDMSLAGLPGEGD